ncbi:hypothetical protein HXX76_015873 [Chlamydomonas incerta]|uniref:Uncharacterized protein n=1 Tax=Chlamydomonas incerta TaxID=51695 RepID=A0A835VP81_CHLIN|nr:hypothetical protein HXX76_015873 [Chlamydomonas incerta]|eukprot:KAG2422635.1 hypothetical protein HXX76_015873 [Chlamydomonas incerta]
MSTARPLRSFGTRIKRTPGPEDGGKPVAGIISVDADAGPDHYKAPSAGGVAGADSGGGGGGGGGGASGASGAALATTRLGITLRGLRRLRAVLRERFGLGFDNMSTAEVNEKWVEVVTAQRRCRLLEMGEWVDEDDVAPPTYFGRTGHSRLLEQVLGYLASAAEGVAVWIDILAVNQHETRARTGPTSPPLQSACLSAGGGVVRACSGGTLVVLDRERCSPATRAWCIYEWAHTLALHGPDGLHLHLDPHDRATVSATIDVEKAECFKPADKASSWGDVRRIHGSAQRFNAKLKLQLLLEPLSYVADIRRLTARAEALGHAGGSNRWTGGGWRGCGGGGWGSWGGAGQGSGPYGWLGSKSRALVVGAGAGEGKSTISARRCARRQQRQAGLGGAGRAGRAPQPPPRRDHHQALRGGAGAGAAVWVGASSRLTTFSKIHDQRRLEPVAIVKSLAFQLAERFSAVAAKLLALDVAKVASAADVGEAVDLLLLAPLKALPPADRRQKVRSGGRAGLGRAGTTSVGGRRAALDALDRRTPLDQQLAALAAEAEGAGGGGGPDRCRPGKPAATLAAAAGPGPGPCPLVCGNRALQLDTAALLAAAAPPQVGGTAVPGRVLVGAAAEAARRQQRSGREAAEAAAAAARGSGGAGQGASQATSLASCPSAADDQPTACRCGHRDRDACAGAWGRLYELYRLIFKSRMEHLQRSDPVLGDLVGDLVAAVMAAQEPLSSSFLQQLGLGAAVPALPGAPVCFFEADHHGFTGCSWPRGWGVTTGGPGGGDGVGGAAGSAYKSPYALRYNTVHAPGGGGRRRRRRRRRPGGGGSGRAAGVVRPFFGTCVCRGAGPAAIGALGGMRRPTTRSRDVLRFLRAELYALLRAAADVEEGQQRGSGGRGGAAAGAGDGVCAARAVRCGPQHRVRGGGGAPGPGLGHVAGAASRRGRVVLRGWRCCRATRGLSRALAFSPDGQQLLSGGSGRDSCAPGTRPPATAGGAGAAAGGRPVTALALTSDSRFLAVATAADCLRRHRRRWLAVAVADGLAVVDAAAPPPRAPAGEEPQQARLLREHRPVSQAGSQGLRGAGALAPATDGVSALVVCGREYGSRAAVISASGGRLLGGGGGGRAAAADVTLPGLPAEAVARRGGGGGVTAVSIEGQFATTGGGDGSIIVWDTAPRGDRASGAAGAAAAAAAATALPRA